MFTELNLYLSAVNRYKIPLIRQTPESALWYVMMHHKNIFITLYYQLTQTNLVKIE